MDARPSPARRRGPSLLPLIAIVLAAVLGACAAPASAPTPRLPLATPAASATPSPSPSLAPSPTPSWPLSLTDDEGTAVTIPAEPRRIVSLTPAATETLFALGLGDRVVGKVEDFTPYPPEADAVPVMAKFGSVDVEAIVAADADLVIAGGSSFNPPEAIAKLRSLGVPVVVLFAPDVDTALADIALVGAATGRTADAAALVAEIRGAFDEVAAAVAALPRPRVYYELDASQGFFGPAPDYFGTGMIRVAGGEPLTSGKPGVYQLEAEQIVAFDPEVILLGDAAYGVTADQVAARPGWDALSAVRRGDVRPIDDVVVTRPGPRLAEGIRALAVAIHPGLALPGAEPSESPAPSGPSPVASGAASQAP